MYPQGKLKEKTNEQWEKNWTQLKLAIDKQIPIEPELNKEKVLSNIEKMRQSNYTYKIAYNIG